MRHLLVIPAALTLCLLSPTLRAQDLPFTRQYFSVAPAVLASATQIPATPVSEASGSVLVIFRRGAAGRVVDAQATGDSQEMQQSALNSIRQWHFKPAFFNNVPAQMIDAATFVFKNGAVTVEPSLAMSAAQLSPRLGFACPNALAHHNAAATEMCSQQLHDVKQSSASTDVERLISHDEYGLALLDAHQPKPAIVEFTEAIRIAAQVMKPTDPEWAYTYLHRASAETQNADPIASRQDLASAKTSLDAAINDSSDPEQAYYQQLEKQFASTSSDTSMAH